MEKQEENTSNTRGAQEEHKRNTREHIPTSWLAVGLQVALGWLVGRNCHPSDWFGLRLDSIDTA
jgi:hypothetical protein